ncbi:MAG: hypothetical protein J2P15_10480 [Micromonosporaceae bacterium]|nr:hypothetical protein [Micromonosporaceae bacterium]
MTTRIPWDEGPGWLRDYQPIQADLSTLAEFAKALQDEVNRNFVPHARRTVDKLNSVPFTAPDGFVELTEAYTTYSNTLERTLELLNAHSAATWDLAAAAETIAKRYRDSDAYSAATVADVRGALNGDATGSG